jgi:hypothetical protein
MTRECEREWHIQWRCLMSERKSGPVPGVPLFAFGLVLLALVTFSLIASVFPCASCAGKSGGTVLPSSGSSDGAYYLACETVMAAEK